MINKEQDYHEYERKQQEQLLEDVAPINKAEVQRWSRLLTEK